MSQCPLLLNAPNFPPQSAALWHLSVFGIWTIFDGYNIVSYSPIKNCYDVKKNQYTCWTLDTILTVNFKLYFFPFSDFTDLEGSPSKMTENQSGMERGPPPFPFQNMSSPIRGYYGQAYGASNPYMHYGSNLSLNNYSGSLLHHPSSLYPQSTRPGSAPTMRLNHTDGMPLSNHSGVQPNTIPTSTEPSLSPPSQSTITSQPAVTESPLSKTTTPTLAGAYRGQRSLHSSPDSGIAGNSMYMGSAGYPSPHRPIVPPGTSVLPDPFMSPRMPLGASSATGYDQNRQVSSLLAEIDNQKTEARKVCDMCSIWLFSIHTASNKSDCKLTCPCRKLSFSKNRIDFMVKTNKPTKKTYFS